MIMIVSESNITIGNTWENGRENGGAFFPGDPARNDIIITAALVALGNPDVPNFLGMFSFEDQNEPEGTTPWEFWTGSYSCPAHIPSDERGEIYLWGSLTQRKKGYTHRSNHGGTGYGKDYHFDDRFWTEGPPYGIPGRHVPEFDPEILEFGEVVVGTSAQAPIELTNEGGTYIDIEAASIAGPYFSVGQVDSLSLLPGESTTFDITFEPGEIGDFQDLLTVELYYGDDLQVHLEGTGTELGITDDPAVPEEFEMSVYPNPFNNQLKIALDDSQKGGTIRIFDIYGRQVDQLEQPNGKREINWRPNNLAGGLYFIQYETERISRTHKVVYLK
jgi:hypothetical protein